MKKNLFTTSLLVLVMCLLLPARVMADQVEAEVDGIWYEFDTYARTATVIKPQGTEYFDDIVIPSWVSYEYRPYYVTSIGKEAFLDCIFLTSINIPEGVTSIESKAFAGCSDLTSATIPSSVTSIESFAFYNCSGLTSIAIPEGVKNIAACTFETCSSLTSITIPESVKSIERSAFRDCI